MPYAFLESEWFVRKTSILLGLPLTQNHRRLRHQWCDERRMWVADWNEVAFTNESRICLQHHDAPECGDTVDRRC
ncbi:transposable element Tcb1 transposase [Trichonephila clavipes]|nr:transposable element Tcb1 transposase [Trichonephila clavipes]